MAKILVTGSTGNVGSRLVKLLSARGQAVRAFVRGGDAAPAGAGVEVAVGDFMDKTSLRRAMDGVSKMYLLSAGHELEQHEANAIEAAEDAGLDLVVKHSVAGAQYKASDIPRWHRAGEERLEASGLPWVFIRPATFASNALFWAATIKSHDTVYGALGDTALPVIDPDDIAEVAGTILTTPGHAGKAYEISGPESLTTAEQVETLASVLGRPLKYVNVPDAAARESMIGNGMPVPFVDAMVGLIQLLRSMGRIEPNAGVQALIGRRPRTFRQWVEANIAAFR